MKWDRERRTPEQDEEEECIRQKAIEREIDRADYLRDELRDRQWEESRKEKP